MSLRPLPPPITPPPLRAPGVPLPPYRYVPGLWPHPFRHADGHLYTDGSAPDEVPWAAGPWQQDLRWLHGLDLFDQRFYWESHEVLEALWHHAPPDEPVHDLLQGLIQAGACVLKAHIGHDKAAARLHAVSRARLLAVASACGDLCRGVNLPGTVAALDAFAVGGPWPLLARPAS